MQEVWKEIEGFESRFKISNFGNIISINGRFKGEKLLTPGIGKEGYYMTSLRKPGTVRHVRVHTLVAETFIPIPDFLIDNPQRCVNHKDGNKLNNHISNLEWVTLADNCYHALKHGLIDNKGIKSANAKLTEADVMQIRELYKTETSEEIATKFNVQRRHITDIVNGVNWKHLPLIDYSDRKVKYKPRRNRVLNNDQVSEVLRLRESGLSINKIAANFNVNQTAVFNICKYKGYPLDSKNAA